MISIAAVMTVLILEFTPLEFETEPDSTGKTDGSIIRIYSVGV